MIEMIKPAIPRPFLLPFLDADTRPQMERIRLMIAVVPTVKIEIKDTIKPATQRPFEPLG